MKIYCNRNRSTEFILDNIVGKDIWVKIEDHYWPSQPYHDEYVKVLDIATETRSDTGTDDKSYWIVRMFANKGEGLPMIIRERTFQSQMAHPDRVSKFWLTSCVIRPVDYLSTDELVQIADDLPFTDEDY